MSISGFMKQINKANQLICEKIGGSKGTEKDEEYHVREKKTDIIYKLIDDVKEKTNEFLQPNPASRAKLWTANNLSKIRGQVKNTPYPQPEGTLGETMIKYGNDLGEDSNFGVSLCLIGESFKLMAGIKYALEDDVKQSFLDPFYQLKENELKEILHLRKKTESRRLDYDCKRRKKNQGTIGEDEFQLSLDKFEESKLLTEQAMNHIFDSEAEHIGHLIGFAEGFLEYHHQCCEILKELLKKLNEKKRGGNTYQTFPRQASLKKVKPVEMTKSVEIRAEVACSNEKSVPIQKAHTNPVSKLSRVNSKVSSKETFCRALYDFDAETAEELDFREGDIIKLVTKLDENWLQGELEDRQGRFPASYVEMLV